MFSRQCEKYNYPILFNLYFVCPLVHYLSALYTVQFSSDPITICQLRDVSEETRERRLLAVILMTPRQQLYCRLAPPPPRELFYFCTGMDSPVSSLTQWISRCWHRTDIIANIVDRTDLLILFDHRTTGRRRWKHTCNATLHAGYAAHNLRGV